ncbi:MAG: hypothetical protein GY938_24610, partial [Ketobacter sp.]|nr:hypothetical protein [Ketobacter sp.]
GGLGTYYRRGNGTPATGIDVAALPYPRPREAADGPTRPRAPLLTRSHAHTGLRTGAWVRA